MILHNTTKDKIGSREFFSIIVLSIGTKLSDVTPTLMVDDGKNASWMIPIIAGLIFFIPFLLILKLLKRYNNKNILEVIEQLTGKWVTLLLGSVLFFFVAATTITESRSYVDIISTMYYSDSPQLAIYFLFIGSSYLIAKHGLEAIGRVAWLSLPYIKISLLFLVLFLIPDLQFGRIFPILGPGLGPLLEEGFTMSTLYGDLFLFTIIYPLLNSQKNFHLTSWIGFGVVVFELALFMMIYTSFYEYSSLEKVSYPWHEITRYVHFGAIEHTETFYLAFWLGAALIRFAIYLYGIAILLSYLFKINEFEPLLITIATLVIFIGILPENPLTYGLEFRENIIMKYSSYFYIIFPFLLWLTAKWKGVLAK